MTSRAGKRARAKKLERLKAFVQFCLTRDWIARDIARDLRAPEGSSTPANKTPFTDDELKKIYDAGITVAMGTDAGAQPVRTMGFSEHMELQLMVKAGLTPLQAITVATRNGAILLHADRETGTLQVGKKASFIILSKDPVEDIRNSRSILGVMKNGKRVSGGPLADVPR